LKEMKEIDEGDEGDSLTRQLGGWDEGDEGGMRVHSIRLSLSSGSTGI
jgi:hypothetical protein